MATDVRHARRRVVGYASLRELAADLDRIEAAHRQGRLRQLGNHSPGAVMDHLAKAVRGSIEGMAISGPFWIRIIGPMVKSRVLAAPLRPGRVKLPSRDEAIAWNEGADFDSSLADLRAQLARLQRGEVPRMRHPMFGRLSPAEWDLFHRRHAELHLSFVGIDGRAPDQ
jgi:hypothetical protein